MTTDWDDGWPMERDIKTSNAERDRLRKRYPNTIPKRKLNWSHQGVSSGTLARQRREAEMRIFRTTSLKDMIP